MCARRVPISLRVHAVNRFVVGPHGSDDRATYRTEQGAAEGLKASPKKSVLVGRSAYCGSRTHADRNPEERVAQTMLPFRERHATNVWPLNHLLARSFVQRDCRIGNIQKCPGDFRRVHVLYLNLLSRPERIQVLPGCWISLGPRNGRHSQNANQEREFSHEHARLSNLPDVSLSATGLSRNSLSQSKCGSDDTPVMSQCAAEKTRVRIVQRWKNLDAYRAMSRSECGS